MSRAGKRDWRTPGHQSSNPFAVGLVGLTILALLGLGGWLWSKSSGIATDRETLCPKDAPISAVTAILLDPSDDFTAAQTLRIKNSLESIQQSLGKFELIEVFTVDRVGQRLIRPDLHLCNPGSDEEINSIYQNPEFAKNRWRKFTADFTAVLDRLMSAPAARTSPIMEAIQAIALRTFDKAEYRGIPKRLIVVSDLMQNTNRLSQYVSVLPFSQFRTDPYFNEVRAPLQDVDVTLLYLVVSRAPQPWPAHRLFWEQYFASQGAPVQKLDPIFGG